MRFGGMAQISQIFVLPLELVDVADLVKGCDFKVFAGSSCPIQTDALPHFACLRGARLTRKEIDDYTAYVARYGAKGWPTSKSTSFPRVEKDCNRRF